MINKSDYKITKIVFENGKTLDFTEKNQTPYVLVMQDKTIVKNDRFIPEYDSDFILSYSLVSNTKNISNLKMSNYCLMMSYIIKQMNTIGISFEVAYERYLSYIELCKEAKNG